MRSRTISVHGRGPGHGGGLPRRPTRSRPTSPSPARTLTRPDSAATPGASPGPGRHRRAPARGGSPSPARTDRRPRGGRHARAVVLALVVALLAGAVPAQAWLGPDQLPVMLIARKPVGKYPAVVVLVGVDSRYHPVSLGEGVVLERRDDRCVILTATGVLGKATYAVARYADDSVGGVQKVLRWEPAPGLALLEAEGPCPAVADRLPGDVHPEELAGRVDVLAAPTWGLQVVPVRASLDPSASSSRQRRREGEAGVVTIEETTASFVLAGAPVLDPAGRLVGVLGRPRKKGRKKVREKILDNTRPEFGFLPVPAKEALLEAAKKSDRLIYYTRIQARFHPVRELRDPALYGMGYYWAGLPEIALPYLAWPSRAALAEPAYMVALADTCLALGSILPRLLEDAASEYRRVASLVPGDPRIHGLLGYTLMQLDRLDEAALAFRKALRHAPGEYVYLLDLGAVLAVSGNYSEAIRVLKQAIEAQPDDPGARLNLAVAYFEQGLFDQAMELAEAAADLAPEDTDVLLMRGMILVQQEQWHEARAVLEKAEKNDPDDVLVRLNLAVALLLCGEADKGREKLDSLFDDVEASAVPRLRLIYRLLEKNETARAIRLLHRLSRPGPPDLDTWRALAEGAERAHDWKLAREAWSEVLHRDEDDLKARAHLGVALVFLRRHDEAAKELAACLEKAPRSPQLLRFLALARIGQGHDDEALELIQRLDEIAPDLAKQVRTAWEKKKAARAAKGKKGKAGKKKKKRTK